jgi:deoxycytidylate deaminase
MIKPDDPRELAVDLLDRSVCNVQVAAVIADNHGIAGWGWNNVGSGFGTHAERHCISRTSRGRADGARIFVAARRNANGKTVTAKPCEKCQEAIESADISEVWYRDSDGVWKAYLV